MVHPSSHPSTQSSPFLAELRSVVGPAGVLSEPDEMLVYESDGFSVAKGMPTAVIFPTDTQQVSRCLKILARHNIPIVPRGSGTGLAGGAVAYGEGVIVSTTRMTRVESIDIPNRVALVQAGVRNIALSEAVALAGAPDLHFSPDPSSQRASTIGGNAATNAGGINTLKHGVTVNHILGIEFVTPDGQIHVARGQSLHDGVGPDITALFCGSEGVLGLVTRLWCRLVPKPKHYRTFYAVYDTTLDACKTVSDVIAKGIIPTSMEMMDGSMIRVVEDAFHYGFPTTAQALLLIEIDGIESILDEQLGRIVQIARDNHATDVQQCSDPKRRMELWSARKKAFGAIGRISHSYCTQDACVPRSMLPDVMVKVLAIGQKYGLKIPNVFHAGDGNIHPILLFDEADPEQVQRILLASKEILEYCIDIGGTLTGEHGVGVEKIHLMSRMFTPATLAAFMQIKLAFDPHQRCNDAKLIPSDKLTIELLRPVSRNVAGGAA